MILRGQLHAHTTMSDGRLTPQETADEYARLGFHFLAITDHDHLLRPTYRDEIKNIKSDLLIFPGIELTVHCSKGYVHVSRIDGNGDDLFILNHPADYDLDLRKTMECIEEVSAQYPLHAVEITNHGFYTPEFDIPEINYLKIAADDSHNRLGCGRGWIELESELSGKAIMTAIKSGKYRNCFAGNLGQKEIMSRQVPEFRLA
ncbi:MAG: hypothetical protein CSYNP_00248 [Syntrophus sp. SKADARSKE-3]|nr:hypothetical protein [Syntrophus sp. SKADARSKE-3]